MAGKKQAEAPRSRLESARARMYHELIFESAEQVFGAKGFDQATMQDIAQEAGVSLKTLYGTFDGKQELYDEIHRVRGTAFVASVVEATAAVRDARARIRALARAYAEFLLEHRSWLSMTLHERIAWGLGPPEGEGASSWRAGVKSLAEIIAFGIDEGEFFPDADTQTLAMTCLAVMQVQVSRALEAKRQDASRVASDIETQLVRLLCIERSEASSAA